MKVTKEWLERQGACLVGIEYFQEHDISDGIEWVKYLTENDNIDWANWLIVRIMSKKQQIAYAIFAARQVLDNFEKAFPNDDRPRKAIEAAEAYLRRDIEANRSAAWSAECAESAAWSAECAKSVAWSAESKDMQIKILQYGISLFEGGHKWE